jgi:carbonic anhydrase/acetyltransferase-like protein (isoleucine patch superfamily)
MEMVGADAVVPPRASRLRLWRARLRPRVRVGAGARIGRGVMLRADRGARLVIGDGAAVGDGARLEASGGQLTVGAGSVLGERCSLAGTPTVGRECVVGDWARVEGDAVLEDRSRLAAHAVALAGARVGRGAVVGSYDVIDRAVAPGAVVEADVMVAGDETGSPGGSADRPAPTRRQTRAPRSSS